jgi:NAD(P)-dependent dehydrogenase (short-subunit alcohol dehydrogenase family)
LERERVHENSASYAQHEETKQVGGRTMKEFKGKVAVITGAASGIGRGIAERCVKEEMKVVIADIEEPELRETEQALKAKGETLLAIRTDVSKANDIETLARKTLDAFGAVHLLFNNAGVSGGTTIWESTLADWQWVINVNLWGVIHGVRVFVPIMLQQQMECHIFNTASIAGLTSGQGSGIYRMTKHGIVSLSETLYLELKQRNAPIGVSVLCPGLVRSRILESARNRPTELQNPSGELLTPERRTLLKLFQESLQSAMSPEQCAELVFKAIQQNTFYILTRPKDKEDIQQRMENILQGQPPTPQKNFP